MKILAIEKELPGIRDGDFLPHSKAEAQKVWELYQKGIFREIYFHADENVAVIILECEDVEEAKAVLNTLPLVENKLIDFEIIPLKAYPGFNRLFSNQKR